MKFELLEGLSPAEADRVLAYGKRKVIATGCPLFRLGDVADSLFLVERGRVRLTLPMLIRGQEQQVLVEEKSAGQTVGWSALIPPFRFTLSATAGEDVQLTVLSREALQQCFQQSPEIGTKLCLNLAVVIGRRLHMMQAMWIREMQRTIETYAKSAEAGR